MTETKDYALERAKNNYVRAWWSPDATEAEIARLKDIYEKEVARVEAERELKNV